MIEDFITHERLLKTEPAIDGYLSSTQINFDEIINDAFEEYLNDVKNQNYIVRKLGKRLSLQASVIKTTAFDSAISDEDKVERRRLIIDISAITGTSVFSLQGSNDDGDNYTDVKTGIIITQEGNYDYTFWNVFKKYRLRLLSIGTTVTYSADLYETTFDFPLLYKKLSKIYYSLFHKSGDDAYQTKAENYENRYQQALSTTHYFYDEDDTGDISADEAEQDTRQIIFRP